MKKICLLIAIAFALPILSHNLYAQKDRMDKGKFVEYTNEFWEKIKESSEKFNKKATPDKKRFMMDFSEYDLPESAEDFDQVWHTPPISQGWTGTCWCFSTTSFLESEIKRIHGRDVKISEIYTVYWQYVEKAREYIRTRGESNFAEGSLSSYIFPVWEQYGCVPAAAYTGLPGGREFHDHHLMYSEMMNYLRSVKQENAWNEEVALETIKSIMNHYLGVPPTEITYSGRKMTPMQFYREAVDLKPSDYVNFMSLLEAPYYTKAEYDVPDNWANDSDFYNIPLDDFMKIAKSAIKAGYSMCIGGDVSETGYSAMKEVAMVPAYDIPSRYIDDNARQLRFSNGATTDDHAIHIVGWEDRDDGMWFLIKDSGSGSRNGKNEGYYFYHEDYIKLKIMNITVHRSAADEILSKFK
ncbi:MAG: C1 family peptidase [Candidatus Kapaibacterium sp.]